MPPELKAGLIAEMKRVGAWDVGIADPNQGFEHAPEGRHPLDLMPGCRSVVAFVVPRADIPDSLFVGLRRSAPQAPDYWTWDLPTENNELYLGHRLAFLFTAYVILKAASYLSERGFRTANSATRNARASRCCPKSYAPTRPAWASMAARG